MQYKTLLLAFSATVLAFNTQAIPNSAEYLQCMKSESSDAGTTHCYENEVKHFQEIAEEKIPQVKKLEQVKQIAQMQEYNLEKQYQSFNEFLESYCKYYVKSKQNQGYSDKYLKADCELGYIQMYAGYTSGLVIKATDPCGEE